MSKLDQLIEEMRQMNENIRNLILAQSGTKLHKIPMAAKLIGISPALLRRLCKKGVVPASLTSDNPRMKHYLVDVTQARKALIAAGFIHPANPKRGPKPTTQI